MGTLCGRIRVLPGQYRVLPGLSGVLPGIMRTFGLFESSLFKTILMPMMNS